jgi:hypothetical protein
LVPVVNQTASTVFVQYGPHFFRDETGEVKECVNLRACKTTTLDNVGIFDIRYAGGPIDIKGTDPLPAQNRHVLHLRFGDLRGRLR